VSDLVEAIRAVIRHELARGRFPEVGEVTEVFAREEGSGDGNHQVNVRLLESGIEVQRAAVAVSRPGLAALPAVGDLVIVAFLGGDLNAPVVLGTVYDAERHPPVSGPGELVYEPPESEESGVRRLHAALPGALISVDDEAVTVEAGGTTLVLEKDGNVQINAAGDLILEAGGKVEIKSGADTTVEAQASLSLKGSAGAQMESPAQAKVKGSILGLAGTTQFSPS